jgi:hypothetical protein
MPDRSDMFFNKNFPNSYFMRLHSIVVKMGEQWRFFDPSSAYIPFGMMAWKKEGEEGLIINPKESLFVTTPLSAPEKSLENRTAKLRLSEDGTLEGAPADLQTGHRLAPRIALSHQGNAHAAGHPRLARLHRDRPY